jgi:hypothetical protein
MKNKLVKMNIVTGLILAGFLVGKKINATEIGGSFSVGYNSELTFRGVSSNQSSAQSSFDTDFSVGGFDIGLGGAVSTKDGPDDIRLGVDIGVSLLETINTSVGFVKYSNNHLIGNSNEIYFEAGAEIILDVSARVYYNTDKSFETFEVSAGKGLELFDDYDLDISVAAGNTEINEERENYYTLSASASREIAKNTVLFAGLAFTDVYGLGGSDAVTTVTVGVNHVF